MNTGKDFQQHEEKILHSWHKNTKPWINVIAQNAIESRRLVTNQAVINTIAALPGNTILDIGCGEGWLVRECVARGLQATGVDAVQAFIDAARGHGSGDFLQMEYETLPHSSALNNFAMAVCNFSLIGQSSVAAVFAAMRKLLQQQGHLVVQTLHPLTACGDLPYQDGWRQGSWAGFTNDFTDPAPWYFRTLSSWVDLFIDNGLELLKIDEPVHPDTDSPCSLLMVARLR